jgi:succinyl-diaminopimelate desuccinylase
MSTDYNPIHMTQTLVRMNTINTPGDESSCTRYLAELLEPLGFACTLSELAPGRASLIASLGDISKGLPLAFTGHVDVVPLGDAAWTQEPFGGDIVDGKLYGRGSSDMKAGVAAFVCAAIACRERLANSAGVTLIITAGEETGCEGAFQMAAQPGLLQPAGALLVAEPSYNNPLIGHKGALWLKATASGVTAHGSMPEHGDNAIYKIARAALALQSFTFDCPTHPLMGRPTLNVGMIKGGLNVNSVPDAAELTIDIRTVAGQSHAQIQQTLQSLLGDDITLKAMIDLPPVYTAPESPWVQRVVALCVSEQTPGTVTYFTDAAALLAPLGNPPTLILGPGETHLAHQTDEYCAVARIEEAFDLYRRMILDWCHT